MLSRSDTAMGRFIRTFTRSTFNHVSVSLDDSLSCFVSFARYRVDIPLAGGYVQEDAQRLLYRGNPLPVVIFRLEIPEAQRQELALLFAHAGEPDAPIYNTLGALLSWLHLPCPVPGAYTCLEFANRLLGTRYRSIPALQKGLAPYAFFEGISEILYRTTAHGRICFSAVVVLSRVPGIPSPILAGCWAESPV